MRGSRGAGIDQFGQRSHNLVHRRCWSAYDTISRKALLRGVADMDDWDKLIPFVRQFYSSPSTFLCEDEVGETRRTQQGEGGEQGDPVISTFQCRATPSIGSGAG